MHIRDVLGSGCLLDNQQRKMLSLCTDFLQESQSHPVLKNLPNTYDDFVKVKVRFRKPADDQFAETFNNTFKQQLNVYNIRQRAVFVHGKQSFLVEDLDSDPFYIFPINGFKFLYSKEITNSNLEYKQVFDTLIERFGAEDQQKAIDIVADLLKYSYNATNLLEGITSGSEVLLYNIPYYYAIRTSLFDDYQTLLNSL